MTFATLFDFNGVLVDDEHVHLAAFREALAPLGVSLSDDDYFTRYFGFDDVGAFAAILRDAGRAAPDDLIAQLVRDKKPLYRRRAEQSLLVFEGAAELVRRRGELGPVAVVSGALRDEIELGLERLGVRDRVSVIVSAEDTAQCKPDPEGYLRARELLGGMGGVVLEDSAAGVRAAKGGGLACIAVLHSMTEPELASAGADLIRSRIADVTDADFDQAWGRLESDQ
ncbi:MAG: HAD family phosphatase [Polyangiaceae bacterium]|nr:HAD family phosphatase [Polyangiaceae bacterium]